MDNDDIIGFDSAFEDTVYPFGMDIFSYFELPQAMDGETATTIDGAASLESSGHTVSTLDYASFIFNEDANQDFHVNDERSEPDFDTSVCDSGGETPAASHSPPPLKTPYAALAHPHFKLSIDDIASRESTAEELPSTPLPVMNYLPSPPITPTAKRSVKRELSDIQFDKSDAPSPSIDLEPPKKRPGKVGRPRKSTLTAASKPRGITKRRTTAKVSLRRKLVSTYGPAKRLSTASSSSSFVIKPKPKRPSPSKTVAPHPASRSPSVKVKSEDVDEYTPNVSPPKKRGRKPAAVKKRKATTTGRKTNNSLSATFGPTIRKRKGKIAKTGRWEGGIGKVCASYYASARGIVPNAPGERYHKGKPEDCIGDSHATVTRHCISEFLQKGARGSTIPRFLRLHWCNKCYMRHRADADYYPRLYSMILDQLEYVAADGDGDREMFQIEVGTFHEIVDLAKAKAFVVENWAKVAEHGRERKFKVVPMRY